jgi:L-aminopeptidase/D-esterase-like protein
MKIGKKNLITDVTGVMVGNSHNEIIKSGVTVFTSDKRFAAAVTVLGGAPGTRETDLLESDKLVEKIDAIVLSGGSAFGLDAATGVVDCLRKENRGYPLKDINIPIVPSAILADLFNGGDDQWEENPYGNLGKLAFNSISNSFEIGTIGAGYGATTSNLKGGLGSASIVLGNGATVGALVAVNPSGSVVTDGSNSFWATPFEIGDEFGGKEFIPPKNIFTEYHRGDDVAKDAFSIDNTTIAIVATDLELSKVELKRISVAAHDGMSRAILPSHTPYDGDLIFAASTGRKKIKIEPSDIYNIGNAAAICLSRAIARGVYEAKSEKNDLLPTWQDIEKL